MSQVWVDLRKWPNREHYQFGVDWLGRDDHGVWLHAPPGTAVRRGQDEPWALLEGFLGLVPEDEAWVVEFYRDHPTMTTYVNIGTRPEWDGSRLTQIDLDLDVIRLLDGTVEVIDEDEFEANRFALGYPAEVVESAREAAERAVRLMRREAEPFCNASDRWFALIDG